MKKDPRYLQSEGSYLKKDVCYLQLADCKQILKLLTQPMREKHIGNLVSGSFFGYGFQKQILV